MSVGAKLLPVADHSRKDFLYSRGARRWASVRGLTLLELVVVLSILAALAGIVVPLLPNLVHRSTVATCTTNLAEIGKLVQSYQALNSALYPDKMDNLVKTSGGLASYMLNGSLANPTNIWFTAGILQPGEGTALNNAGITQSANLIEQPTPVGDWAPTYWPYSSSRATPLNAANFTAVLDGAPVAVINASGMSQLGLPASNNERYVIYGLNIPCTLFRNLAQEPPYHNPDHPDEDPALYYKCFGLVFLVSYTTPATVTGGAAVPSSSIPGFAAKFMGPVGFDHDGPVTASAHLSEWFQQAHGDQANQ
jgi:prepilin-type N-terminal cleavage/methylation domain-containing protein